MNKLSFEYYFQKKEDELKEMALGTFKWQGKEIGHINNFTKPQINWILEKMLDPKGAPKGNTGQFWPPARETMKFMADDGSGRLSFEQVIDALKIRQKGLKVAPTSTKQPVKAASNTSSIEKAAISPPSSIIKKPEIELPTKSSEPDQKISDFDPEPYRIKPEWVTKHQKEIREIFKNTSSHILLPALAGAGKTTMLKDLASNAKPGERWLYLVFNKKNQQESKKAFPPGVDVFTSHSFLEQKVFSLNPQVLPSTGIFEKGKHDDYSEAKAEVLINKIVFGNNSYIEDPTDRPFVKGQCYNLLSKAKNFAVHPNNANLNSMLISIMEKYKIETINSKKGSGSTDYKAQIISICTQILKETMPKSKSDGLNSVRDHDDTLWWTAIHADQLKWPHYNVVLADEVQDFNVCQQIMLKKLEEAGARIVAVGDENQAIYAFRGADAGSFSALGKILGDTDKGVESKNLPVNFRSSPAIIDYVNKNTIVSNLEAGKKHEGSVEEDQPEDEAHRTISQEWSENKQLDQETAFLSRTNNALAPIALEMLVQDIPVTIVGRNLSEEFTNFLTLALWFDKEPELKYQKGAFNIIKKKGIRPFYNTNIEEVPAVLMDFYYWRTESPKMSDKVRKEIERTATNLSHLIEILIDKNAVKTVDDFIKYLKIKLRGLDLGTDGGGGNDKDIQTFEERKNNPRKHVVLSTIHKSKGLEFERVFVLENDKLPDHETSKKRKGKPIDQEQAQEENLKYVAYTRAKNRLHLINNGNRQ